MGQFLMDLLEKTSQGVSFLWLMDDVLRRITDGKATPCKHGDETFADLNVDSLNIMLLAHYMFEFYGVNEEQKSFKTPNELYNFIWQHKTKEPQSIEACMAIVN